MSRIKPDRLAELVAEAKSHATHSAYDPQDDPLPDATPDAVLLAYAEFKSRGQDDDAAALLAEYATPAEHRGILPTWAAHDATAFFDTLGPGFTHRFAEWRPYTNPDTGRAGFVSSKGLVRYDDPRGDSDTPAAPRTRAKTDVSPERVEKLAKHLAGLGDDALAGFIKSLRKSKDNVRLADMVTKRVKELSAEKAGGGKSGETVNPPPVDLKGKDPNHPAVAELQTSPHVARVFAAMSETLGAHRESLGRVAATRARLLESAKELDRIRAEMGRVPAEYGLTDPPGEYPDTDAGRLAKKMEHDRKAEGTRKSSALLKEKFKARDVYTAAYDEYQKANEELAAANFKARLKLAEVARPEHPAEVAHVGDIDGLLADGRISAKAVKAAKDGTEAAFAVATGFARDLVNLHEPGSITPPKIQAAYCVSRTGRGFCQWSGPETGVSALFPYTVAVSEDVEKGSESGEAVTAVHEIGHAVEHRKRLVPASKAFLAYRCGDEKFTSLKDKFGGSFDATETGRKDEFDKAMPETHAYYVGKDYATCTEVFSMGLQYLYAEPATFMANDPEFAAFVIHHLLK